MDLRIIKTKSALKKTMIGYILDDRDYMNVSIKEICEKAHINRRTFYLHYRNVGELLVDIQDDLSMDFYERTKQYDHLRQVKEVVSEFFHLLDIDPLHEKITLNPALDDFREKMRLRTMSKLDKTNNLPSMKTLDELKQMIVSRFYNQTCVYAYREWYKQGKKAPIDSVIDFVVSLLNNGLASLPQ